MGPLKIAVEHERGLHDATDFTVANIAPQFLAHVLNKDEKRETGYFVKEGTLHQTEFNSVPSSSLHELCQDFLKAEKISDQISAELGVVNIPISETGAGLADLNPATTHRTHGYRAIFGKEAVQRLIRISGIHLHVDQYPERLVDQFNALTALRPTIAFTSTSSISHEGKNSVNCHRYIVIADPITGVFAAIPEERGYITSMDDLLKRDIERYGKWMAAFASPQNRQADQDFPPAYDLGTFRKHFEPENTGYPDVRFRPKIGQGTYELRINDTAPLDIVLAQAAVVLGYVNRIMQEAVPVEISRTKQSYFNPNKVLLPSPETLSDYTSLAVKNGLQHPEVNTYLHNLLEFAKQGLPPQERHFLQPLYELLAEDNLASQVLNYLGGHKPTYSPAEAARANQWMWKRHKKGVAVLQERMEKRI
ncbi:MAG: glutamate-cysteine ligase family protein [Nanoarchaeota archaeon]|nr:glutamate-cysteine ligase family protein [Nanoarchaeota archaeon]